MSESEDRDPSTPQPRRVTRYVQPLGPRVLVRIVKDADRLESGLFLPEGAKDEHAQAMLGEVIEVARTQPKHWHGRPGAAHEDEDEDLESDDALGANVSGIPLAANVLFPKDKGVKVPWDDTLRLLEVRHVLALVEVIDEEDMQ